MPSNAERDEIRQLQAALNRVELERNILQKGVTIFAELPQHEPLPVH